MLTTLTNVWWCILIALSHSMAKGNGPPVQSSETPSTSSPTSHTLKLYDDDDNDEVANAELSSGSAPCRNNVQYINTISLRFLINTQLYYCTHA